MAASNAHPKYVCKAFANPESGAEWLSEMAEAGYRFKGMAAVEGTDHFSKELQGLMWMVMELLDMPVPE